MFLFSSPQQLMIQREDRQLEATAHVALLVDRREHVLDGLLGEPENAGDLAVGAASHDPAISSSRGVRSAGGVAPPVLRADERATREPR
jgi:hypothetical protein